jgi:serine/threonine-protein kinase RsbW
MRSEVTAISPFADSFMHFIKKCRCVLGVEREVEVALREALANAVVHGNHKDPRKRVYVSCCCETDGVSLVIRDEGQALTLMRSRTLLPPAVSRQIMDAESI